MVSIVAPNTDYIQLLFVVTFCLCLTILNLQSKVTVQWVVCSPYLFEKGYFSGVSLSFVCYFRLLKEVDKKYTGWNLKTTDLLDCARKGYVR